MFFFFFFSFFCFLFCVILFSYFWEGVGEEAVECRVACTMVYPPTGRLKLGYSLSVCLLHFFPSKFTSLAKKSCSRQRSTRP